MSEPSSHQKHVTDTIPYQNATGVLPVMSEKISHFIVANLAFYPVICDYIL